MISCSVGNRPKSSYSSMNRDVTILLSGCEGYISRNVLLVYAVLKGKRMVKKLLVNRQPSTFIFTACAIYMEFLNTFNYLV